MSGGGRESSDRTDGARLVVLLAGGGTGGHLFPNLAIAEVLRERLGADVSFEALCSRRAIDASILSAEGVAYTAVAASSPTLRPMGLLRFLRGWAPSVREGRARIRSARRGGARVVVVASGGFVAAPIVQAARVERCPVVMLNLDAVPGRANRWIAGHATRVFTTATVVGAGARLAAGGRGRASWESIPPIVRRGAVARGTPAECKAALGLGADRPTLLVTGGSQGATSINRFMAEFVRSRPEALKGWQVVHQAGGGAGSDGMSEVEVLEGAYRSAGVVARVREFLREMGAAWGSAEVCVCRAGAGNVGEAWASRTPSLFMPYPYHKDEHQRANAAMLVERGAGLLARDAVDPGANMADAGVRLAELLGSSALREQIRGALASLGPADGAERVASAIVELAGAVRRA